MGMTYRQWPWFAILAKSGREKYATMLLENSGFESSCPSANPLENGRIE